MAGTLVFGRALANMRSLDPGWNRDGVVVAPMSFDQNGTSHEQGLLKQRLMLERVSAIPGVEVAALATKLPIGGRSSFGLVEVPGVEAPNGLRGWNASVNRVSARLFRHNANSVASRPGFHDA